MKKQLLLSILLLSLVTYIQANIITVSNTTNLPGSPGQYTTLQAAHDAAYSGDTILVQGSPTVYPDVTFSKKITLFGPGYNPQRENTNNAYISSIYISSGCSGTTIMGVKINNIYIYNITVAISNLNISRNDINSISQYSTQNATTSQVNIYNNIISSISGNPTMYQNWNITNNIITGSIYGFGQTSVYIKNNLFISASNGALSGMSNVVISNNIFSGSTPYNNGITLCAFNNNLTYNCTNPTLPYGTNVGSGNKNSVDPMLMNVPNPTINYTYNYRINSSSPAKNAGTDGTDIGITGGMYPMYQNTTDLLTGEPPIPKITLMSLINSSVPAGGNLQFNVKAKKVN